MRREPVTSEAMRSVGYDPRRRMLEIEFADGDVYRYLDVPPELHLDLMRADSHGEFFAHHIRDAGFEYGKVDD
jgi:hypothetical protein